MRRNLRSKRILVALSLAFSLVFSNLAALAQGFQGNQAPPKPPINQSDDPLLRGFAWRSIGPASMGGRIDDIEAVESNPYIVYVGFATSGLWKSVNNGTTWEPIFDTYPTASIGDVAICQSNPNIIWVGTGEPNNRQSSTFGDGVYKSTDGGKTFTNVGLKETQSISRVVIDPKDPNTVYVAALGHLFGANKERGIFKTTDGGKTWANVKFIDEDTGFTDLVIDPSDSKTLVAASYQRRRAPWGFNGGGNGSALWKTTDAGKSWTRIESNGWPEGLLGRVGIDIARSNPNVLYAQVEVGVSQGTGVPEETPGGQPVAGGPGGGGGGGGFGGGQNNPNTPPDPKKSGLWRSDDKGKTWRIVSSNNNRPMYYSQVRVDPSNAEIVYTGGLNFSRSTDGGKTFKNLAGVAHSDHHAIWINPKNGNNVIVGNDGGLDISYDQGETFDFVNTIAAAQFYAISADMRKPYFVCGGLQDNGSWCGPSQTRTGGGGFGGGGGGAGITNAEWFRIGGGDGFYTLNDP
ncbi:MAG: WD40/YVTN/BNR-like repeat-containing protein, partial [Blastocatellia bacterium]